MTSSGWMLTEWIGLNSIVCTCIASICSEYFYTYTIYTLECIYLFCKLIYFKYTYTLMHLFASICSSQRNSMHSVLIYASSGQLQLPQIHTYGGIMGHHLHLYTYGESYTIMHLHLYTYTLMQHHIQCNKLKPQHSLVQCTLCMWYMHVPPPDTTDSHLWSYCVCVEVSILGPI